MANARNPTPNVSSAELDGKPRDRSHNFPSMWLTPIKLNTTELSHQGRPSLHMATPNPRSSAKLNTNNQSRCCRIDSVEKILTLAARPRNIAVFMRWPILQRRRIYLKLSTTIAIPCLPPIQTAIPSYGSYLTTTHVDPDASSGRASRARQPGCGASLR